MAKRNEEALQQFLTAYAHEEVTYLLNQRGSGRSSTFDVMASVKMYPANPADMPVTLKGTGDKCRNQTEAQEMACELLLREVKLKATLFASADKKPTTIRTYGTAASSAAATSSDTHETKRTSVEFHCTEVQPGSKKLILVDARGDVFDKDDFNEVTDKLPTFSMNQEMSSDDDDIIIFYISVVEANFMQALHHVNENDLCIYEPPFNHRLGRKMVLRCVKYDHKENTTGNYRTIILKLMHSDAENLLKVYPNHELVIGSSCSDFDVNRAKTNVIRTIEHYRNLKK